MANKILLLKTIKILIASAYIALGLTVAFILDNLSIESKQKYILGIIIIIYGIFRLIRTILPSK
ncbi:MAG: hypothetical protein ACQPRJ_01350 [Solitalea-like symbiont of Acarus siro]